jgi:hypothetical protein
LCHICLQAKQAHKDLILDDDDDSFPSLPLWENCLNLTSKNIRALWFLPLCENCVILAPRID